MEIANAVRGLTDLCLKERVEKTIGVVLRTLELFGPEGVAFSFNGGKDSTVVLHILRAATALYQDAAERREDDGHAPSVPNGCLNNGGKSTGLGGAHAFIFEGREDFPEILEFVSEMDSTYQLHLHMLGGDFKSGLSDFIAKTGVKAILLGTRRGDPNAVGQEVFCPSSPGWPPFMRVNPILEWSYEDVWAFLLAAKVPYCVLYDHGYTSLGKRSTTHPNTSLRKEDGSFAPAYMLADGREERAGRETDKLQRRDSNMGGLSRRATIIIVGDEILAAKVEESNSRFLCRQLRSLGWRVCKVTFVPDEVRAIAAEVRSASDNMEVVITCGGVGPTLDDVTVAGVADAFGYRVARDPNLEKRLREQFQEHLTNAHLKMADLPTGDTSWLEDGDTRGTPFPVVVCRNVYMLPGVPSLMERKWEVVKADLQKQGRLVPFHSITFRLAIADETIVAGILEDVAGHHEGRVALGSYPVTAQVDGAGLVLSLVSKDSEELALAAGELRRRLPVEALVCEETDSETYYRSADRLYHNYPE